MTVDGPLELGKATTESSDQVFTSLRPRESIDPRHPRPPCPTARATTAGHSSSVRGNTGDGSRNSRPPGTSFALSASQKAWFQWKR